MSIRLRCVLMAGLLCAPATEAIAQAARTTFVPGLGASSNWWRRQNTVGRLWQQVNLIDTLLVDPGTTSAISSQSSQVQSQLNAHSGMHVLVGASLGGIVIRDATRLNPGHAAGILTVGTPHRGALVADNGTQLIAYTADVVSVVVAGMGHLGGPAIGAIVSVFAYNILNASVKGMLESSTPVNSAAAVDAKTTSSAMIVNRDFNDGLPHAAVYGTLDRRFAWMKVSASALNGTPDASLDWENKYRSTMGIFKKCLIVNGLSFCDPRRRRARVRTTRWHRMMTSGSGIPLVGTSLLMDSLPMLQVRTQGRPSRTQPISKFLV